MILPLKTLAENTLIRDILLSGTASPLLAHCSSPAAGHLDFSAEFVYDGKLLSLTDNGSVLPVYISQQVRLLWSFRYHQIDQM